MSQRSVVEFNHDLAFRIQDDPETFTRNLGWALSSGSDRAWESLRHFGLNRVVQLHHSDDRKIVASSAGVVHEYPFA